MYDQKCLTPLHVFLETFGKVKLRDFTKTLLGSSSNYDFKIFRKITEVFTIFGCTFG